MFQLRHEIGDLVKDRYTIREVLGAGAFGTVYRVDETIGTRVLTLACKEMHVLSDPATTIDERADALRMFQEEAYLLQTLRNPHIPAAYFEQEKGIWLACPTCGLTFRGMKNCPQHGNPLQVVRERYYLIMDFLDGPDLEQTLENNNGRPLDEEPVLDWALQICDALEAVHAKGLSHRDIKPANIKAQGSGRQAMLIDFGLVKPANMAGAYGTVLKRGSTGTGTIGYAPESAAELAHPDARTDILAFGMTLYRLLSRRDPTDAADLAEMRRSTPGNLNLRLSEATDGIIIKMIKASPDDRYADVQALRLDLQAARYPVQATCPHCGHSQRSTPGTLRDALCERCGRAMVAGAGAAKHTRTTALQDDDDGPPLVPRPNPYEARIRQIQELLRDPPAQPPFPGDARIASLEATLSNMAKLSVGLSQKCPACSQVDLVAVTGQPNGVCPLCNAANLVRRQWDLNACAVCRQVGLVDEHLTADQMFCPVCCKVPLKEAVRRRFAVVAEVHQSCGNCGAEFEMAAGARARLVAAPNDPLGVAKEHNGQTLAVSQWRIIGGRALNTCKCPGCSAQWDVEADGRLKLVIYNTDPFGVGARFVGTSFSRSQWSKLAANVAPETGNLHCPHCAAEFDYDRDGKTMQLLQGGNTMPAWAADFTGPARPLPEWYFAAAGKGSGRPGCKCPACHTEFDNAGVNLQLISTSAPRLQGSIGEIHFLKDWQMRGQGLPTGAEAHAMRAELQKLLLQKQNEQSQWQHGQALWESGLQSEFVSLLKQSVLGGFVAIKRMSPNAPAVTPGAGIHLALPGTAKRAHLRASEQVLWESLAFFCTARRERGEDMWMRGPQGTLLVSNERILFNAAQRNDRPWDRALTKIETVQIQTVQGVVLVVLTFRGEPITVGFELSPVRWEATVDGKNYTLTFTPQELVNLLLQQIQV